MRAHRRARLTDPEVSSEALECCSLIHCSTLGFDVPYEGTECQGIHQCLEENSVPVQRRLLQHISGRLACVICRVLGGWAQCLGRCALLAAYRISMNGITGTAQGAV